MEDIQRCKRALGFFIFIGILIPFLVFSPLFFSTNSFSQILPTKSNTIYRIYIDGEIDLGIAPFIKRILNEAESNKVEAVLLEINTLGGRLDSAIQIRDSLLNSKVQTVAYINKRAISAGALISLACKSIVMTPGATIGAATPVTINPFDREMKTASEKVISYFRNEMKATAEKNGRPSDIAEAMVDPDVEIKGVIEKGKLLTLTSEEAIKNKVADYLVNDGIEDTLSKLGFKGVEIVDKDLNWAERLARFLTGSLIGQLLLIVGIIGLFIEFKAPGWGLPGTLGIICLALFFWGHSVVNLVGWEELIILLVGIILLIAEVFFIPGFGVAGISGIVLITIGLTMSLVGRHPTSFQIWQAFAQIAMALSISIIFFLISIKSLAKTRLIRRFVLHPELKVQKDAGGVNYSQSKTSGGYLLNKDGIAETDLRPSGKAIVDNQRLTVLTEGDYIKKGTQIKIIKTEGSKIVVKAI
ncbi:MAG: NfeD family protein [bacterium]